MLQTMVINDILIWIEDHIEDGIIIEDVVNLSGYSRRYIQHLFKKETGFSLGGYLKRRRLCRGAMYVRLTTMRMLDIAVRLRFDSQQSFSREFKKLFNCPPYIYRTRDYWELSCLCPPWEYNIAAIPETDFVQLPQLSYSGHMFSYSENILGTKGLLVREREIENDLKLYSNNFFYITYYSPSIKNSEDVFIKTFSCQHKNEVVGCNNKNISIPAGEYLKVYYEGSISSIHKFIKQVYFVVLPEHKMARRRGCDIEYFDMYEYRKDDKKPYVKLRFFVPVISLSDIMAKKM
ncbi:TPA: helix-turn-helix domain-containing protein [Escherichia coli]|nr:helix-turn-helix domain-containing protein [Escherichia coli]